MALDKIITDYVLNLKTFKKQTKEIEKDLEGVEDSVKDSTKNVSKEMDNFGKLTKKIGGFIAAAFAADKVISFGKELVDIQRKAIGIETAFGRLNSPALLNQLRRATKGTVSDLQLMQRAVQAKNYNIPLNQLATLFEFARRRAKQTGEEVDVLVDKIVLGLGRKSPLILDDLGVSSHRLRAALGGVSVEAASVGQFVKAFGDIAKEEIGGMGKDIEDLNERIKQNQVRWENLKKELSEKFLPVMIGATEVLGDFAEVAITDKLSFWEKTLGALVPGLLPQLTGKIEDLTEAEELLNEVQFMVNTLYEHQIKLSPILVRAAEKQAKANNKDANSIAFIRDEYEKLQESLNAADGGAAFSIKILRAEISSLKKEIEDTPGSGRLFERLIDQLSVKQKTLNDIMFRYNALLNARKNLEEEFAEEDTLDALGEGAELNVPGVPTEDQEQDLIDATDSVISKLRERWKKYDEQQEQQNVEFFEGLEQRQVESVEIISNAALQSLDVISQLGDRAFERNREQLERQLNDGKISQAKFDAESKKLDRKQALRKKSLNLFESIIATLRAINEASPNVPLMAFAAASGAVNSALIASQPIPSFSTGVVQLQGDGTETSDSIPALLSKNESVITAAGTRQDVGLFKAANRMNLQDYIHENYVLPELQKSSELSESDTRKLMQISQGGSSSDLRMIDGIGKMKNQSKLNTRQIVEAIHQASKRGKRRSFN